MRLINVHASNKRGVIKQVCIEFEISTRLSK